MSGTISVNMLSILVKHGYKVDSSMTVSEFREDLHSFIFKMEVTHEARNIIKSVLKTYNNVQYKKLYHRLIAKGQVR